ncbi:MAG: transporter suffix domain-containing protein [Thiomicrorhabdus sp.]|nr:transporter suffix domain-containing protein [Thiomicrorhabdus sp.]
MSLKEKFSSFIKPLAYILIAISTIAWTMVFVIPFLDYSVAEITGIITVLIIAGEVTFYLAILLLGKTVWNKMKETLLSKLNKLKDTP